MWLRSIFLDTETLTRRFSESRSPHPLRQDLHQGEDAHCVLLDAIKLELELLASLRAKIAQFANRAGIPLKQRYAAEGKQLRRLAGGWVKLTTPLDV